MARLDAVNPDRLFDYLRFPYGVSFKCRSSYSGRILALIWNVVAVDLIDQSRIIHIWIIYICTNEKYKSEKGMKDNDDDDIRRWTRDYLRQTAHPFLTPYRAFSSGKMTFRMRAFVLPVSISRAVSLFNVLMPGLCTRNALSNKWNS